jgi:hypothetical protein
MRFLILSVALLLAPAARSPATARTSLAAQRQHYRAAKAALARGDPQPLLRARTELARLPALPVPRARATAPTPARDAASRGGAFPGAPRQRPARGAAARGMVAVARLARALAGIPASLRRGSGEHRTALQPRLGAAADRRERSSRPQDSADLGNTALAAGHATGCCQPGTRGAIPRRRWRGSVSTPRWPPGRPAGALRHALPRRAGARRRRTVPARRRDALRWCNSRHASPAPTRATPGSSPSGCHVSPRATRTPRARPSSSTAHVPDRSIRPQLGRAASRASPARWRRSRHRTAMHWIMGLDARMRSDAARRGRGAPCAARRGLGRRAGALDLLPAPLAATERWQYWAARSRARRRAAAGRVAATRHRAQLLRLSRRRSQRPPLRDAAPAAARHRSDAAARRGARSGHPARTRIPVDRRYSNRGANGCTPSVP